MDKVDVLVIGAGVVGLAVARALATARSPAATASFPAAPSRPAPRLEVAVVERHDGFGRETSSRNSEVIHCGMYYGENLLKTRLCVRGRPMLYDLCQRQGIPYRKTGKIVLAADASEERQLQSVFEQGRKNGVLGLRLIGRGDIAQLEKDAAGALGIYSPESGIVDSHALMQDLERSGTAAGAVFAYGCEVVGLARVGAGYDVEVREAAPEGPRTTVIQAAWVVNSAGLSADKIASMAGIDVEREGYAIRPCKGEYFRVSDRHKGRLSHLVYPVPTHVHLGAHAVLGLDGRLRLGPSSFYVDTLDYAVDPSHRDEFLAKARRILPFLDQDDLTPDQSGIRPKLYREGEPFRDFIIREESDRGLPGLINLVGIESPGLTSCLSIAQMVAGML